MNNRNTKADLITVGKMVEELAMYEESSDLYFVCWTPDHLPCYPTIVELDEDGDLCICLDEDKGENYDVGMMLAELEKYDDDVKVYVAARGLYMNIDSKNEVFFEDNDEYSDHDVIACNGKIFGKYKYNDPDDVTITSASKTKKQKESSSISNKVVGAIIAIAVAAGLGYAFYDVICQAQDADVSVWTIVLVVIGTLLVALLIDLMIKGILWLYDIIFQPETDRIDVVMKRIYYREKFKRFFRLK